MDKILAVLCWRFFTEASPLRTSASRRSTYGRQWIHALFNSYSKFNLLLPFGYIRVCQGNSSYYPKHLLRWRSGRLEAFLSWTSCIAKKVRVFQPIICSFYEEKEVLTECSDVCRRVVSTGIAFRTSYNFSRINMKCDIHCICIFNWELCHYVIL